MGADLVCKIVARTPDGKTYSGSGYPITPNRIITAAHVVVDAVSSENPETEGGARCIEIYFGGRAEKLDVPVYIEWSGADHNVDVAVLRCQLPPAYQPVHRLSTQSADKPVDWFAQGYTDIGQETRPAGLDAYHGWLAPFRADTPTVALEAANGPLKRKEWAGGSGSVAFDTAATGQTALAVITEYQGGRQLDDLVAVPICYLLHAEATQAGFRKAIQFESYQRRENRRTDVMTVIASHLKSLGRDLLRRVAEELCRDDHISASGIDLDKDKDILAQQTADCLVAHSAVSDVVRALVSLAVEMEQGKANKIADIVDYLLPLNYAPAVILRLHEQLAEADGLGLIENEVATRTLAEIIMAGYDQQRATFVKLTDDSRAPRGPTALEYIDGPEEGPGDTESGMTSLREVRNFLYDLVAALGLPIQPRRHDTDVHREIEGYARQLRGTLRGISGMHRGRTVYCPIALPADAPQRELRKRLLSMVRQYLPQLIFVELVPMDRADEQEFEIDHYIRVRWIRP